MARSNWNESTNFPVSSLVQQLSTTVPTGGGTNSWAMEVHPTIALPPKKSILYTYNGPSVSNFPSKYPLIDITVAGSGEIATRTTYGAFFTASNLSGSHIGTDSDGIFVGVHRTNTAGGTNLRIAAMSNGVTNLVSSIPVPVISSNFIQFQAACLINDLFMPQASSNRIIIYIRYNTGTAVTTPGSAGWTSWVNEYELLYTNFIEAHTAISNGAHVSFGVASDLDTVNFNLTEEILWNNISVSYGAVV